VHDNTFYIVEHINLKDKFTHLTSVI